MARRISKKENRSLSLYDHHTTGVVSICDEWTVRLVKYDKTTPSIIDIKVIGIKTARNLPIRSN